jgi:hypothetical protein
MNRNSCTHHLEIDAGQQDPSAYSGEESSLSKHKAFPKICQLIDVLILKHWDGPLCKYCAGYPTQ